VFVDMETGLDIGEALVGNIGRRAPDLASSGSMTDVTPRGDREAGSLDALALAVGCEFELKAAYPVSGVIQVAPCPQPGVLIRREQWDTASDHHGYFDLHANRCERFSIDSGSSRIAYEAELLLSAPADVIEPDAMETPVASLPDDVLSFVMPSRFCLPDELGNEAWQRFGGLAPGWGRVQAIVDFVHGHLQFTPGASNPWTTAADVYRARQGVCRDFAHLAITFCRALNIRGAVRVRLHPGRRGPPTRRADGLRCVVRGLSGWSLVRVRCSEQHAAGRTRRGRAWPGRDRRRADHILRSPHADWLPSPCRADHPART